MRRSIERRMINSLGDASKQLAKPRGEEEVKKDGEEEEEERRYIASLLEPLVSHWGWHSLGLTLVAQIQ